MTNEIPFGQRITDGWDKLIEHLNRLYLTEEQIALLTYAIRPTEDKDGQDGG